MRYVFLVICTILLSGCQQQAKLPKISELTAFIQETNELAREFRAGPDDVVIRAIDPELVEAVEELVESTKDKNSSDWAYIGLAGLLGTTGLIKRKK